VDFERSQCTTRHYKPPQPTEGALDDQAPPTTSIHFVHSPQLSSVNRLNAQP
jgi:hypothetical protein